MTTTSLQAIKDSGNFLPSSIRYSRRKLDKKYEVIGKVTIKGAEELGLEFEQYVTLFVLDFQPDALEIVQILRGSSNKN